MARKSAIEGCRGYVSMALGIGMFALLVTPVLLGVRTGSPEKMVQAQVRRGGTINPTTAMAVPNADENGLVSSSNFQARTLAMHPGPAVAPDASSIPEMIERAGKNYLNLTFAELASFPFVVTPEMADASGNPESASLRTREQIPDAIKNLGGQRAAITGFMLPVSLQDGLAGDFLLLRNQSACCYGIVPRINEWVIIHATGRGIKPIMDVPVTVLGTFHVGEIRQNQHLLGIYQLECDQMFPTKLNL